MKLALIVLSLVASSLTHADTVYRCVNFNDAGKEVATFDLTAQTATLLYGTESHPYKLSSSGFARNHAPTKNLIPFEGGWLADTGKLLIFNTDNLSASLFIYGLLDGSETTLGPVPCERDQ